MTYQPSKEAVDSIMRLGEKIAAEARRDRQVRRATRERETKLLAEFNANRASQPPKPQTKGKSVWITPDESYRLAQNASDMFAAGKMKAEVCDALAVPYRLLTYHLEKHGMKGAETNAKLAVRKFEMSEDMRETCDELRPHTSWDDIAARLGINRSTLIKHYMRHTRAKRGGRCNARTALAAA